MTWGPKPDPHPAARAAALAKAFTLGLACGALLTVVSAGVGFYAGSCSLYTRPEPYTPPPLVLQGTKPLDEDAGHDR